MLDTLNNFDKATAQGILANLTLGLLPNPGISQADDQRLAPDENLRDDLLNELRVRLRLKHNDNSPKAMAKLYAGLADELKEMSLSGNKLNTVKARLGQQGILSLSQYVIKFVPQYRDVAEKFGISQFQAEEAVRNPTSYEHLVPEHFGFNPNHATSVFAKTIKPTATREGYIILVLSNRKGFVQEVISAWRVYASDVALKPSSTPVDVLRSFIESFGTEFAIGNKTGKLFMNERLPVSKKTDGKNSVELFKVLSETAKDFTYFFGTGRTDKEHQMVESVLSFAIDYNKYAQSLKRHGVNVNLSEIEKIITQGKSLPYLSQQPD